jgi:hypothetical protein
MAFNYKPTLALLLTLGALAGCKQELPTPYSTTPTGGYANLSLPNAATLATKYAPGESIPLTLGYNAGDSPSSITVFQATRTDSSQAGSYPVQGTFNTTLGVTTQTVPYTVPTTYPIGSAVRVDVTLNFPDGGQRLRRITYTVASSPTLTNGTPTLTYRNGLAASAQTNGDIIGYAITLNAGGISTVPTGATSPPSNLFKNVDSLVYYARAGTTGTLQRQGVIRTPTAGVANSRTIDVRIPSGSAAAGGAQFVFTAFAQSTSTSLTSALVPVVASGTALATTRRGAVSFGGGSSADSLAFNLSAGLPEPAANASTGKDLQVSGLSTAGNGALTLSAPNTTRYYKLTSSQLAANPYATATANQVGLLLYQNTASADLGAPTAGDVYAVRLRGASTYALLRVLGTRASTSGGVGRVKFEYRTL